MGRIDWSLMACNCRFERLSPRLLRRSLPRAVGKALALPASRAARASALSLDPIRFKLRRLEEKFRAEVGTGLPHHPQRLEDLALGVEAAAPYNARSPSRPTGGSEQGPAPPRLVLLRLVRIYRWACPQFP